MPPSKLLSPAQRESLLALPDPEDARLIARHYTLSHDDLALIRRREGDANRLGFALQLCYLRYPGRRWKFGEQVPEHILNYVSGQVKVSPVDIENYSRQATHSAHLKVIRDVYNFEAFDQDVQKAISAWLLPLARSTDHGEILVKALIDELRRRKVILPALSTLEALAGKVREQARRSLYEDLTADLTESQLVLIDNLLDKRLDTGETYKTWLLNPVGQASPANFWERLHRLTFVRRVGLDPDLHRSINQDRLKQLAREGERLSAWRMERTSDILHSRAMLVAFLLEMEGRLIDQALMMHDRLITSALNKAKKRHLQLFHQDGRSINETVRHYREIGRALIRARQRGANAYDAIESVMTWDRFVESVEQAEQVERPESFDYLEQLSDRYGYVRQYSRGLWEHFDFQGGANTRGLRQAISLLYEIDAGKRSKLPEWAPLDFVSSRWKPYIRKDKEISRTFYELCALVELRDRLRSGDVWITGSKQYSALEAYLLPDSRWRSIQKAEEVPLQVELDFEAYIKRRREKLDADLKRVNALMETNALPEAYLKDGKILFSRTRSPVPDGMNAMTRRIYKWVPPIRITDLLLEVDASTGISKLFTDIRTGEAITDRQALFTAILADAVNLGLLKMAEASAVPYYRLSWLFDWYIRGDTYNLALSEIVNHYRKQPLVMHWGDGTAASSDGQFFPVGGTRSPIARISRHYGGEPGLIVYTHVSDQREPFFVRVISTSEHQAPYALDGLLYHESDLNIHEHYTDTGGYTDHVFAMFHLLGFQFAPRLRRFNSYRLYTIKKTTTYSSLTHWIGGRINVRLIRKYWDDILRLASSVRMGTVSASLILKRLGGYSPDNFLSKALREVGRLEKTLFMLNWMVEPALRYRVTGGLNKSEEYNALAQAVAFYRQGKFRDRTYESQSNRASGLTLVIAAIALWNTVYLTRAVDLMRERGEEITDEHLQHLSPLHWNHINLTGDYTWNTNLKTNLENLRPIPSERTAS